MKLQDIKKAIIDKSIGDNFLIFLCEENYFIADQYIEAIATIKNFNLQYINSLAELETATALVTEGAETLYVLKTDTFEEIKVDYSKFENTIVVCKKIDKKLDKITKDFVVKIPKLEEWQVVAYIQAICPDISTADSSLFYKAAGKNIYKVDNEISKVALFDKTRQREIFMSLLFDDGSDMYSIDTFELSNKIIENNKARVYEILARRKYLNLDPFPLIGSLLKTFKQIVLVNHKSGITDFAEIGMSPAQVSTYKRIYSGFALDYLADNIKFLSGLDYKLKSGLLDMNKDQLLDYIICNDGLYLVQHNPKLGGNIDKTRNR